MSAPLRLLVFDVDGTLVDSQADILASMHRAFAATGRAAPERDAVLGIVGLSLDHAMARLAPEASRGEHAQMVAAYRQAYFDNRAAKGSRQSSPLYPGARDVLEAIHAEPQTLLGVATGKSRRGLDALLEGHGLRRHFVTTQVADDHPSKPHPSMLLSALRETGVAPDNAVMIGDTSFDMDMARAAGIAGIGVTWGYHPRAALASADMIVDRFGDLAAAIDMIWRARG